MAVLVAAALCGGCGPTTEEMRVQAVSEYQVGHIRQAKDLLQRVLSREPSDPQALFYMGRIACAEQAWEDAIYYLQCSLDSDPSNDEARVLLEQAQRAAGTAGPKLRFIPRWPAESAKG